MSVEKYTDNHSNISNKIFNIDELMKKLDSIYNKIYNTKFIKNNINKYQFYRKNISKFIKYIYYVKNKNKKYAMLTHRKSVYIKLYNVIKKNIINIKTLKVILFINYIKISKLINLKLENISNYQNIYVSTNTKINHNNKHINKYNFIERTFEFIEDIQFIRKENRDFLFDQLLETIQDDVVDIKDTKINNFYVFIKYANIIKFNNTRLKNRLETKLNGNVVGLQDRFTVYKIVRNIIYYIRYSQHKLLNNYDKLLEYVKNKNNEQNVQIKQDQNISDNKSIEISDFNNKDNVAILKNGVDISTSKIEPIKSNSNDTSNNIQIKQDNNNKKTNFSFAKGSFFDISNTEKIKVSDYQIKIINNLNDLSDLVVGIGAFESKQDFLKAYNENNQQSIRDFIEYMGYCSFLIPNEKTTYFENILKIYFKIMEFDNFFVIGKHKQELLLDCTIEYKLPFKIIIDDVKFIENFYNQFGLNYLYVANKKIKLLENPDYITSLIKSNCDIDKEKLIDIYKENRNYVVRNYIGNVYFTKQNNKMIHYNQFNIDDKDDIKTLISYIELYNSIDYSLCDENGKKINMNNLINIIK